jgi:exonuclease III
MEGSKQIKICSYNANGLNDFKKRKDVFDYLRGYDGNIFLLQECHWLSSQEDYIRNLWGFDCIVAGNNSSSRGVAILFRNNFEYKVHDIIKDDEGRYIILSIELLGKRTTLGNIYGPSRGDHPEFFNSVFEHINVMDNESIILGGDWNFAMDPKLDTNHAHVYRPNSRCTVRNYMEQFFLTDIFRELNPGKRKYTWRRFNSMQRSRLDFFLVSEEFGSIIDNADMYSGYISDHSLVYLTLKTKSAKTHRPFWKFNNSLLKDPLFVDIVKKTITDIKKQYAARVYDLDNIDNIVNDELSLMIDDQLFFEVLLMELRSKCISYSVHKKKTDRINEEKLMELIKLCEEDLNESNVKKLDQYKEELFKIRQKKVEGMIIRSRARWIGDGEKNSSYFCRLEKRNYVQKAMNILEKEDGTILVEHNAIVNEVKTFYEKLYSIQENEWNEEDFKNLEHPTLTEEESKNLEGLITMEELTCAIKNLKNEKTPGTDGFTAEFFKFFFIDLKSFILRSINNGFLKGEMSVTQRQGVITCIPKEGKEKRFIKNWRPITLLNTVYKVASSCIAERIKAVLPNLIHQDQQGFMKNRNIGENIRLLYDTLIYAKEKNMHGLILSIDFFKAFDSVSWSFIQRALTKFNFGEDIKKWICTFYNNISSCVHVNGQYSQWFCPKRGTRQGDPLSPYLFLMCVELMAIMMRENPSMIGIKIDNNNEVKVSQFADDTTLFLDGSKKSFEICIKIIKRFARMSGLTINFEKSSAVWIGRDIGSKVKFMPELKFVWNPTTFKCLGVIFSINTIDIAQINYEGKLDDIKKVLNAWTRRNLTPFGKITVIKTLVMSKLTYLFMNIPDPSEEFLNELQKLLFLFLWNGKQDRIKRQSTYQTYENGGLKMINVKDHLTSLKINWLKRILSSDGKISRILNSLCPAVKVMKERGGEFANILMQRVPNPYWFDVFKHYKKFYDKINPTSFKDFLSECLHYNAHICQDKRVFYKKNWIDNGVVFVGQLFGPNSFLTYNEFVKKYPNVLTNFLIYEGLIRSIKGYMNKLKLRLEEHTTYAFDAPVAWQCVYKGGTKYIYNCLMTVFVPLKCIEKWSTSFDDNIDTCKVFKQIKKTTNDTFLRWFQYRLLYRILPTQRLLCMQKIVNVATCTFCGRQEETLDHLFWDCIVTQGFWNEFTEWLHKNFHHCENLVLSKRLVIFGCSPNVYTDYVFDLILLIAKYCIFSAKTKNKKPHIQVFINAIKQRYLIERRISIVNNNSLLKFKTKWVAYIQYFETNAGTN